MSIVNISSIAPGSDKIRQAQDYIRLAFQALQALHIMSLYASSDGADVAAAEAFFGLEAGDGLNFYNDVAEALSMVDGTATDATDALRSLAFSYNLQAPEVI